MSDRDPTENMGRKKLGRPPKVRTEGEPVESRRVNREVSTRVPFGGFTFKLEVANKDPNFYYYWFKDRGDNIERALRAGYEFVNRREADRLMPEELTNRDVNGGNQSITDDVRVFGGRDEYGRDYNLVLMRQPMEYHLEDQAAFNKVTDQVDSAIFRQNFENRNIANKYGDVTMTVKNTE